MRNRAKCKLCKNIIESFHENDYVDCPCGEISIHGGLYKLGCSAKDFSNFIRVDDNGNEVIVKVIVKDSLISEKEIKDEISHPIEENVIKREEKLKMLDEMIENIEKLPSHAMYAPVNHADFCSALMLISSILNHKS